jgi:acetyl-CoA carboxylase carboxyltransferase component
VSWEPELEELRRREELAQRMGGEERVARQHAAGRLDVRERLHRLFDPGSFHETGAIAGKGDYGADGELEDFLPANMLIGQGRIDGRRAVVQGDDFTVRGGAADAAIWQKMVYAERMAALREEIRERLDAVRSPFRTAERFGVEEIIDPRDTRPLLCDWAERAHELVAMEVGEGPKGRGLRPSRRRQQT